MRKLRPIQQTPASKIERELRSPCFNLWVLAVMLHQNLTHLHDDQRELFIRAITNELRISGTMLGDVFKAMATAKWYTMPDYDNGDPYDYFPVGTVERIMRDIEAEKANAKPITVRHLNR